MKLILTYYKKGKGSVMLSKTYTYFIPDHNLKYVIIAIIILSLLVLAGYYAIGMQKKRGIDDSKDVEEKLI